MPSERTPIYIEIWRKTHGSKRCCRQKSMAVNDFSASTVCPTDFDIVACFIKMLLCNIASSNRFLHSISTQHPTKTKLTIQSVLQEKTTLWCSSSINPNSACSLERQHIFEVFFKQCRQLFSAHSTHHNICILEWASQVFTRVQIIGHMLVLTYLRIAFSFHLSSYWVRS